MYLCCAICSGFVYLHVYLFIYFIVGGSDSFFHFCFYGRKEWTMQGGSGEGSGSSPVARPAVGGLYSSPDVQSLWSYD